MYELKYRILLLLVIIYPKIAFAHGGELIFVLYIFYFWSLLLLVIVVIWCVKKRINIFKRIFIYISTIILYYHLLKQSNESLILWVSVVGPAPIYYFIYMAFIIIKRTPILRKDK